MYYVDVCGICSGTHETRASLGSTPCDDQEECMCSPRRQCEDHRKVWRLAAEARRDLRVVAKCNSPSHRWQERRHHGH